jgi:pseudouridine-5'-phosphate glycosidase
MRKLNRRDLPAAATLGWSGGTTVSATMVLARAAGLSIFATGGIGGVHRGDSGDVSADLDELARTPVAVVCSGAKAILDLDRTLEWLETRGVPVVGWRTDIFPEFFSSGEKRRVSVRVDSEDDAARLIAAQLALGSGLLLCVPCPSDQAVPRQVAQEALAAAEREAASAGVGGKELTPFLLRRMSELTSGRTLTANVALLKNNAAVAARLALALARSGR